MGDANISWPRLMRAQTAARYVDERSVRAFRRAVGTLYRLPTKVKGKGERWFRDDLDHALARLKGQPSQIFDARACFDAPVQARSRLAASHEGQAPEDRSQGLLLATSRS